MSDGVQNTPSAGHTSSSTPPSLVPPFSEKIHKAFDFVAYEFRHLKRKDPDKTIPAVSHLAGVAYLLAQYGFPEHVVIAGILHDYLEDVAQTPFGELRSCRMRLENEFGHEVVSLIEHVTQKKYDGPFRKRSWEIRNREYIGHLCAAETPLDALAISCADKIHNIQSLIMALERNRDHPEAVWQRMKATPGEQLAKFREHHQKLSARWSHPILDRLGSMIDSLAAKVMYRP